VITTIDAWVNLKLAGAFVTDASTASRTMLLDLERGDWSAEAGSLLGIDVERLPRVAGNDEVVGETRAFGPPLPVTALVVDQQAALLGQSCLAIGETKCTYGTGAFIQANAGAIAPHPRTGLAGCVAWEVGGELTYCLDGQVYTAAAAVNWLREVGLLADLGELDRRAGEGPPAADAPVFVPALAGLGSPYWSPGARGGWVGLSLATRSADLIDAVVWGIAAQVALLAGEVERDLGRPLTRLRVDGGLSRSARMLQAQADLLGIPVERYPSTDATCRGIGALALLGARAAGGLAEAVSSWRPSAVLEPRIGRDQAAELLAAHAAATRALIGLAP
jgi:glycerol kinase